MAEVNEQPIVFEDLNGNADDQLPEAEEWQAPDDTGADLSEPLEEIEATATPEPEKEPEKEPEPEIEEPEPQPPVQHDMELRRAIQEEREHRERLETQLQTLIEKDAQRETTAQKAKLAVDMSSAREQLRAAIEASDIDAQVKAQMNVSTLAGRMQVIESTPPAAQPQRPQAQPQPAQALAPKASAYQARNTWIGDPKFPQANQALHMVDQALSAEGHSPNDDSYFEEMSKRLSAINARNPLGVSVTQPAKPKAAPKTPRPGVDRGEAGVSPTKARRTLTAVDKRDMLQFSMDPKNATHVKYFLRERIARERQEAKQARGVQ